MEKYRILIKGRYRPQVDCRQMVWYMLRVKTSVSFLKIAEKFNCNHSTVVHGINALKRKMAYDDKLSEVHKTLIINL